MKINGVNFDNIKFEIEYKIISIYPEDEYDFEIFPFPRNIIKQNTYRIDLVSPVFKLIIPKKSNLKVFFDNLIKNFSCKSKMVFEMEIKPDEYFGEDKNIGNLFLHDCLLMEKYGEVYKFTADYYDGEYWKFNRYIGSFRVPLNYSGNLIDDIKKWSYIVQEFYFGDIVGRVLKSFL